jgi:hypothetical protein
MKEKYHLRISSIMVNNVSAKRMLTNRKLLAVSTLGTGFFLLGIRANATVIGNIQKSSTFNFSPTNTVFLDPGDTEELVPVGASSTLTASSSTNSTDDTTGTVSPITVAKAVPEPFTILGSGVALGFGALFKKEYSKKQKKVRSLEKQNVELD